MAPVDVLQRLTQTYFGHHDQDKPAINTTTAALLSITYTLLYVLPFYASPTTRPSPTLNRDAPSVIRARIRCVTLACILASASTLYLLTTYTPKSDGFTTTLYLMGWWPISPLSIINSILLIALLFLGPLYEHLLINHALSSSSPSLILQSLSSWQGYRNYIAGPITEEVLFRSCMTPLHLLAKVAPNKIIFLTPLYFSIAHIHHFYEHTLTHPDTPLTGALLRSLFQLTYTTVFGWLATFIYLRTGSLYACIIIHIFCNWLGFPRLWGKVERKEDFPRTPVVLRGKEDEDNMQPRGRGESSVLWTVAYYVLLFAGIYFFYSKLYPLTTSRQALVAFAHDAPAKPPRRWF